jgi:hypothetical protein
MCRGRSPGKNQRVKLFFADARRDFMLQWKPRLYAVLALAALLIAAFGGYAGDAGDSVLQQFGW